MVASSRSASLARYPLIICPMAVVRSGKFHSFASTWGPAAPQARVGPTRHARCVVALSFPRESIGLRRHEKGWKYAMLPLAHCML